MNRSEALASSLRSIPPREIQDYLNSVGLSVDLPRVYNTFIAYINQHRGEINLPSRLREWLEVYQILRYHEPISLGESMMILQDLHPVQKFRDVTGLGVNRFADNIPPVPLEVLGEILAHSRGQSNGWANVPEVSSSHLIGNRDSWSSGRRSYYRMQQEMGPRPW